MKIFAKYKNAKSSPQKLRLLANLIKNKYALDVINDLNFLNKKSSNLISKTLKSAIFNAKNNFNVIDLNKLIIKNIFIDCGKTIKRIMPRAKGRCDKILKRTSHITIYLSYKI